jgi:hypothetical protein
MPASVLNVEGKPVKLCVSACGVLESWSRGVGACGFYNRSETRANHSSKDSRAWILIRWLGHARLLSAAIHQPSHPAVLPHSKTCADMGLDRKTRYPWLCGFDRLESTLLMSQLPLTPLPLGRLSLYLRVRIFRFNRSRLRPR